MGQETLIPSNFGATAPIGILVFARMDSKRLPGKALKKIDGTPMLGHVIERVRSVDFISTVVLATTDRSVDDELVDYAASLNVAVFRGDCMDVLSRALSCAKSFGFEKIIRVCGDSPFIDPTVIEDIHRDSMNVKADIYTNVPGRTYPYGVSVELITTPMLEYLDKVAKSNEEREHVTKYAYDHPEEFNISLRESQCDLFKDVRLVVDTPRDLVMAEWVMKSVRERGETGLLAYVKAARVFEERCLDSLRDR